MIATDTSKTTQLTISQERFLEEIGGLVSALNRYLVEAQEVNSKSMSILSTLCRIEDKIDTLNSYMSRQFIENLEKK